MQLLVVWVLSSKYYEDLTTISAKNVELWQVFNFSSQASNDSILTTTVTPVSIFRICVGCPRLTTFMDLTGHHQLDIAQYLLETTIKQLMIQ